MTKNIILVLALTSVPVIAADYFYVASNFEAESADLRSIRINLKSTDLDSVTAGESATWGFTNLLEIESSKPVDARLITWSTNSLPEGLTFSNGVITGVPLEGGLYDVNIIASYKGKSASQVYRLLVKTPIAVLAEGRMWANGSKAKSCEEYIRPSDSSYSYSGSTGSGSYMIQPNGMESFAVYCDMTTHNGGWTLVSYRNGNPATPADVFVSTINKGLAHNKDAANTLMSLNLPSISSAIESNDVMAVVPEFSANPIVELGQGRWHYDSPDCTGTIGHVGATAGCTTANHTANDDWNSHDKNNIAFYGLSANFALIPAYPYTHNGGQLCSPGKGACGFHIYFR